MNFALVCLKFLFILTYITAGYAAVCNNASWQQFKNTYKKTYASALEDFKRQTIFCDNVKMIAAHNERFRNGEVTYSMKINRFADWTHEDFLGWMHGSLPEVVQ